MQVITATQEHFGVIEGIAHATWPATFGQILSPQQIAYMLQMMYSPSALQEQTEQKNHVFLLAQDHEGYQGYCSYELNYRQEAHTKIHKIYILPTAQGKGVGGLLMNTVAQIAQEKGQEALLLNVNRYNKAVQFYERLGYGVVDTEDIDIGNGFLMEDFVMKKPLIQ